MIGPPMDEIFSDLSVDAPFSPDLCRSPVEPTIANPLADVTIHGAIAAMPSTLANRKARRWMALIRSKEISMPRTVVVRQRPGAPSNRQPGRAAAVHRGGSRRRAGRRPQSDVETHRSRHVETVRSAGCVASDPTALHSTCKSLTALTQAEPQARRPNARHHSADAGRASPFWTGTAGRRQSIDSAAWASTELLDTEVLIGVCNVNQGLFVEAGRGVARSRPRPARGCKRALEFHGSSWPRPSACPELSCRCRRRNSSGVCERGPQRARVAAYFGVGPATVIKRMRAVGSSGEKGPGGSVGDREPLTAKLLHELRV